MYSREYFDSKESDHKIIFCNPQDLYFCKGIYIIYMHILYTCIIHACTYICMCMSSERYNI